MKTLLEAILDKAEVTLEDSKLTVKESVLQEDDTAKCLKTSNGYSVRSGKTRYGKADILPRMNSWGSWLSNIIQAEA